MTNPQPIPTRLRAITENSADKPLIGCVPSRELNLPERIEHSHKRKLAPLGASSEFADLRSKLPPVYNQGSSNSCVAHACAGMAASLCSLNPSRSYLYYYGRKVQGNLAPDAATTVLSQLRAMETYGVCDEAKWMPANPELHPLMSATDEGEKNRLLNWKVIATDMMEREDTLHTIKQCIVQGYPVVFGCYLFASFMRDYPSVIPMPVSNDRYIATHSMLIVGYTDWSQLLVCRNSWGEGYGDNGHFYAPYDYLLHFGFDAAVGFKVGGEK